MINRKNIRTVKSIMVGGKRYSTAHSAAKAYTKEQCWTWWQNHLSRFGVDPVKTRAERENKMFSRVLPIFEKMIAN